MFVPAPLAKPASSSRLGADHISFAGRTSAPRSATFRLASQFAPIAPRVEALTPPAVVAGGSGGTVAGARNGDLDSVVVAEYALHRLRHHPKSGARVGHDRAPSGSGTGTEAATACGTQWGMSCGPTKRKPTTCSKLAIR
jgi:hypothetical protein